MIKKIIDKKQNQRSFYFDDYNHHFDNSAKKYRLNINDDRVYLLFFIFFS